MSKPAPPKPPKKSERPKTRPDNSLLTGEVAEDMAEDVRLTSRRLSFKSFFKWLLLLLILLLIVLAGLVAFISTDKGTQYFLDTIRDSTKVELNYDKGNFVSGLWLKDIAVPLDKNSTIYIDKTRVKIGWQQLFDKEIVHLRNAYVHQVTLKDINPPSGRPFDYPHLKMPMRLLLSQVHIERFVYAKATRKDVVIDNIRVKKLDWQDDILSLQDGHVTLPHVAQIDDLTGKVTFQDTYPIKATANITVPLLEKQGFSPLQTTISDSLETLSLHTNAKWHDNEIQGELTARPVIKGLPYKGVFGFNRVHLPYLSKQEIVLSQGALAIKGNLKQTAFGLDADIVGKDIPKGRYRVSGQTAFKDMLLKKVTAKTDIGSATLSGKVGWKQGLDVSLSGQLNSINAEKYLPASAQPYLSLPYTGQIKLDVTQRNHALVLDTELFQNTGDAFDGVITLKDNRFNQVTGRLMVQGMPNIPVGTYDVDVIKQKNKLKITQLDYRGSVGKFDSSGAVVLPSSQQKNSSVAWQADLRDVNLNIKDIAPTSPLTSFVGNTVLSGTNTGNSHRIEIKAIDAQGVIEQKNNQSKLSVRNIRLLGQGKTAFQLVNGSPNNLKVSYAGDVVTAGLPAGQMVFDVVQQGKKFQINQLVHRSQRKPNTTSMLSAKGYIDTQHGVAWKLAGQLTGFNPAVFLPAYSGNVTGNFVTDGVWHADTHRINIDDMYLTGHLKNKPLVATGKLKLDFKNPRQWSSGNISSMVNRFYADNLQLKWADNQFTATGDKQRVSLRVDVSTLQNLYPHISGRLKGAVNVTGLTLTEPTAQVDLSANAFRVGSVAVEKGKLVGKLNALGSQPSNVKAQLSSVRVNQHLFDSISAQLNGTMKSHHLVFKAHHDRADISGQLVGGFDQASLQWQGKLQQGQIGSALLALKQQQPAQVSINTKQSQYLVSPHCWKNQQTQGSFCLDKSLSLTNSGGVVHASLKNLGSEFFKPFLPSDMAWKGRLQGNAKLNWQQGKDPKINALFYTDNGTIGLSAEDPQDEDITLSYNRLSLIFASHAKGLKVRFDAKTATAGNGYIDAVIDPKHPDKTINGAMVLDDIQLNVLRPFFPGIRALQGKASLAGGMSGPLKGPQFYGNFKLENGAIAMLGLPINLTDVNLKSSIRGTQASLTGDFLSGKGKGKLTGQANWKNTLNAKLKLTGKQLGVRYPPTLYAEINPNVLFEINRAQKKVGIMGEVDVVKGTLRAPSSDPNIIRQSSDVIVIRDAEQTQDNQVLTIDPEKLKIVLQQAVPWRIKTNVNVKIVKDTKFSGFGANIPLQGSVRIKQSGQSRTQGFGRISIGKRLPVNVFGQNLDLTKGNLTFAGNITKPKLDIEAVRKVTGSLIGVRVKGSAAKPSIEIFNDAGLSNQQAMNALVTGRIEGQNTSTTQFQDSVNNALAAAGLNVGLSSTNQLTNRIGRNLGLSALTLGASGSDNDTNVNITGYITPDLYLRYGVGVFTPVNKLTMRYQLSKRVYVEASSAIEKAIDIFYNWRF